MILLDFMRHLRGYVYFQVEGPFAERFLNLTARARIPVWDTRRTGGTLTACADASSYRKLRAEAKKAGVRIRITGKKGMPFTRRRYRKRHGLALGCLAFFLFLFIMSQFIWRIEVNGTETIPDSRIIEALEDMGIGQGTLRMGIDVRDSERRVLLKVPELAWAALNIDGSTIRVEVDERVLPPEVIDPHDPCNLVAAESGQVTAINVFDGQAMVSVGDAVLQGDILISGITQDAQDQNLFKHARGEVFARCEFFYTVEVPLQQTHYVQTGQTKTRTWANIFGFELPLFLPWRIPSPYHIEMEQHPATFFSLELPFYTLSETYILMQEEPVTLDEEAAKAQSLLELSALETVYLGEAEILERTLTGSINAEQFTLKAHYVAVLDIAQARAILIESAQEE